MAKLRVGLLFGGRSVEHDVSILSARSILSALDRRRYAVSLIGVDPDGHWHLADAETSLHDVLHAPAVVLPATPGATRLEPGPGAKAIASFDELTRIDVVFPIIHGRGGEDGTLQGLLELAEIPYVGSGVLSSALQMDKDVAKRLLSAAGLPVTPWICFSAAELERDGLPAAADRAAAGIGLPVFVKPANSGSSVGISRADSVAELVESLSLALRYDRKVLVEAAVDAREIEVAVLGNDDPRASVPGEIVAAQAFYDYDAKYRDDTTRLVVPADLDPQTADALRETAIQAFRTLDASGLARVDFLVERDASGFVINELNSLPGFTDASMFPRLWEATGVPYPALLDRLIELALERHAGRAKLETHAPPPLESDTESQTRNPAATAPPPKPDSPPIAVREIDHVVLRVRDLVRSLEFYEGVLGCREERRLDELGLVQLRAGASLIDLVAIDSPLGRAGGGPRSAEGPNVDHFALALADFDEPRIREQLARHGLEADDTAERYGARGMGPSIYLRDPDGNTIELKGPPRESGSTAS